MTPIFFFADLYQSDPQVSNQEDQPFVDFYDDGSVSLSPDASSLRSRQQQPLLPAKFNYFKPTASSTTRLKPAANIGSEDYIEYNPINAGNINSSGKKTAAAPASVGSGFGSGSISGLSRSASHGTVGNNSFSTSATRSKVPVVYPTQR